jgi:predicted dehydrogenase
MNRRRFLQAAALAPLAAQAVSPREWTAAIIGHTGAGNYGHGLDTLFNGRSESITVRAVADVHEAGRARVVKVSGAKRQYADYREMLAKEKPELVSIGPRWTVEHHAMGMAALRANAHVFMEKPFVHVLAEADEMLAEAKKRNRKFIVAHQMRMAPSLLFLKGQIAAGLIGDLLEIHTLGKMDARAGGEDMMVLGSHLFDLVRLFAGDPLWCTARIREQGREVTIKDVKQSKREKIGPLIGDEINAQFALPKGVIATFTSRAKQRAISGGYGLRMVGSKGVVKFNAGYHPTVLLQKRNASSETWERLPGDPALKPAEKPSRHGVNNRLVDDWFSAIIKNHEPAASAGHAMKAIEMIMAVQTAGLHRTRVPLPLKNRRNPLAG